MACAYLGLGSNLGDRRRILDEAAESLAQQPGIRVIKVAPFLETDPVGYVQQGKFLNTVAAVETTLTPHELLTAVQQIESDFGRVRTVRWGPRTLDIDILLYDNLVMSEPELTIPHPRMTEREFVLIPLAGIAPELKIPPGELNVCDYLNLLRNNGG